MRPDARPARRDICPCKKIEDNKEAAWQEERGGEEEGAVPCKNCSAETGTEGCGRSGPLPDE